MLNIGILSKLLGLFAIGLGFTMLPAMAWSVYYGEAQALLSLLQSAGVCIVLGGALALAGLRASTRIYLRESVALVSLTWIMASLLGALPFVFAGVLNPVDAIFESTSGFSTTGSSVMTAVESAPRGILFWRALTHWLGGAGIIVLFVAVMPFLGAGAKMLFKSESSGPSKGGFTPRIKDTALIVWAIYCGMTVVGTIALMFTGFSFFDAICHTFAALSSGGFSTRQVSVMAYDNLGAEIVLILQMVCAGTSFGLFYLMARGHWRAPFHDVEWKTFIALLAIISIIVAVNLTGGVGAFFGERGLVDQGMQYDSFWTALRYSSFQVVSMMSNTGFTTANFDQWPELSRMLLIGIMFLGGCAGSTTAGLKLVRVLIIVKMIYVRMLATFTPHAVRTVRIGTMVIDDDAQRAACVFAIVLFATFIFGSLFLAALGVPFTTAISASACTLNGTGPGLEHVGAVKDFHLIPNSGKLLLSFFMVLGRLELFTLYALFLPSFWRRS